MSVLANMIHAKKSKKEQARMAVQNFIKVFKSRGDSTDDFIGALDKSWLHASYEDVMLNYDSNKTEFTDDGKCYMDIRVSIHYWTNKKSSDGSYEGHRVASCNLIRAIFFANGLLEDILIITPSADIASTLRGF